MGQSHSNLPDDVDALRAIIAAQALQLAKRDTLIDKLKAQCVSACKIDPFSGVIGIQF